jgi:phosphoglycolate phosphatase
MAMKDKIILFDLDGTIINPKVGLCNSFRYTFDKLNVDVEEERLPTFIGPPLKDTFLELGLDPVNATQVFREYFTDKGIKEYELYNGIEELLITLKSQYTLAVATSKPTVFARTILKESGLSKYFDFIEGSNLDNTRTAKVEIIQAVLDQGFTEGVMIGDRVHDIIGGQAHNLKTIGVTYGYGSLEEFANADYIVNAPKEIAGVIIL